MAAAAGNGEKAAFRKLPTIVRPTAYDIRMEPDLVGFTFKGEETVVLEVAEPVSEILLHASQLAVQSAVVEAEGLGKEMAAEATLTQASEELKLTFPSPVPKGQVKLRMAFTGVLNDKLHGFYRSKYSLGGVEKHMATTQFESTYARQAFPCWDEPEFKAVFSISLTVPKALTGLSNMPVREQKDGGDKKTLVFEPSPKMSSYLVAFIVGEFDYITAKNKLGTEVRVYTLPGKQEQGRFALECGMRALEYYTEFFGVPYPLPKSDLIAIPDFSMGAMENWGLVTYREVYLLVEEGKSSLSAKTQIALIVGHELAHMWFGNLATPKWWTDLWLKEGFATYCEYMFVAHQYPEFHIWMSFANDEIGRALGLDGLKASHPIEVEIGNPNELEEIYDGISYAKSASIIGMLKHYVGAEAFQKATAAYLKEFQYANAETQDLWRHFSAASGKDIADLMAKWTGRMGYPLITVSSSVVDGKRQLQLSQRRFLADGSQDTEGTVWNVPITLSSKSSPDAPVHKFLLSEKAATEVVPGVAEGDWLKLNSGMNGLYRVAYSPEMLAPLHEALKSKALGPLDRFNLVQDAFALVQAKTTTATSFLDLIKAVAPTEDNYNVWVELDQGVGTIRNSFIRQPAVLKGLDAFIRAAYLPAFQRLGWEQAKDEAVPTSKLRALLLARLGICGEPSVSDKCKTMVEAGAALPADLRGSILRVYGSVGGAAGQAKLKELFAASDMSEEQRHCLIGLAYPPDGALVKAALDFGMEKVRPADMYLIFAGGVGTAAGQDVLWAYLRDNFDKIAALYGGPNSNLFQHICKFCTKGFAEEERAGEVEGFFRAKNLPVLNRPVNQILESIRLNANVQTHNLPSLTTYLA